MRDCAESLIEQIEREMAQLLLSQHLRGMPQNNPSLRYPGSLWAMLAKLLQEVHMSEPIQKAHQF